MALTVDWSLTPFRITCPKSDLTLVSGTKYQITVQKLWELLRDFSDSEEAIPRPILYTNIPPTSSTPRIISVNDDYYDFQFENGSYSVEIVNGNSNIRDVEVKNTVSVGTNNTTGFIDPKFLEYATFEGGVHIDAVAGMSGTSYPLGTPASPVDNVTDAKAISDERSLHEIHVVGDLTMSGNDFDGYNIRGDHTDLTLNGLADARIYDCYIGGTIGGGNWLREGMIAETTMTVAGWGAFHGWKSGITGPVHINKVFAVFHECTAAKSGNAAVEFDLMNSSASLHFREWSGNMLITNGTVVKTHDIHINGGHIEIDSTTTEGTFYLTGIGTYTNNGGANVVIQDAGLISKGGIWNNDKALTTAKFLALK